MIDNRTTNLNLPLPHQSNTLLEDVDRLRSSLTLLDTAVAAKSSPADITAAIAAVIDSSPGALDTLNELAAALGDDANFAGTITTALAGKLPNVPATASVLGGVKIGVGLTVDVAGVVDSQAVLKTGSTGSAVTPAGTTAQRDASPAFGYQRANSTTGAMEWWTGSDWLEVVGKTSATGSEIVPAGTTAQRDGSPQFGYQRANSTTGEMEWWNGSAWAPMGGGATGANNDKIFMLNGQNVTANYSIPAGQNAMSAGPITVDSGVTVTVPSGSVWSIV